MQRLARPALGLSILLLLQGMLASPAVGQNVTELYVSPDTIRIEVGRRLAVTAQAFDDAGNAVLAIRYRVADSTVAKVATNGTVSGIRRGRTEVVVTAGRRSRSIAVIVAGGTAQTAEPTIASASGPVPASDIALLIAEPAGLSLLPTEHAQVRIRAARVDGTATAPGLLVWKSQRPEVVSVNDSLAIITALATGQGTVQATAASGVSVVIPVSVALAELATDRTSLTLAPGERDSVVVTVPAQGNRLLRPGDLQWSSSDPAVVQVSGEGVLQAVAAGRAEVVIRGFLQERRVAVLVHQRIARFLAAPRLADPIRLPLNGTREITLIPQTVDSLPIEGVPIGWTVGDTAIARFDPASGTLTARRSGTTTLTFAARGYLPRGWTIEVLPGNVGFDRPRVSLRAGEQHVPVVSYISETGQALSRASGLRWSSSNPAVARVTPEGSIEAVGPGRATVTAEPAGGQSAQLTVLVTGDLLIASTRGGKFGIYAVTGTAPDTFVPVLTDSSVNYLHGTYSPDRSRLAYVSDRFGNYDVFVADADGRNPVRLTTDPGVDLQPVWTPDGRSLVISSGRSGTRQLYVLAADGSDLRELTAVPGGAEDPALSPDGRTVVFTGFPYGRDQDADIFAVPFAGGAPQAVTLSPDRHESRPVFLPGGELTWVQRRREKRDPDLVVRQAAAGTGQVPLLSTELALSDVAIAVDGSRIAWVGSRTGDRNRVEFTFQWRSLTNGAETVVRLLPGERITSPAF